MAPKSTVKSSRAVSRSDDAEYGARDGGNALDGGNARSGGGNARDGGGEARGSGVHARDGGCASGGGVGADGGVMTAAFVDGRPRAALSRDRERSAAAFIETIIETAVATGGDGGGGCMRCTSVRAVAATECWCTG
jgi:hypothetical protein